MQPHPGAPTAPSAFASHLALLAVGTGLYLGWQTIGISPTLFPQPAAGTYGITGQWAYLNTALVIALLTAYTLTARRWSPDRSPGLRRWLAVAVGGCVCAGSVLTMACGWLVPEPVLGGLVAGQVLMAAKAGFIVLWGALLCRVGLKNAFACIGGAYVTAFCVCLLVANLSPGAAITLRCVLPALSTWAYLIVSADPPAVPTPVPIDKEPRSVTSLQRFAGVPWSLFVGIGLFGAIIAFANHLSETKMHESTELYTLVAGLAVSLILLAIAARTSSGGHLNFILLYRLITPLLIGCLMLTLILEPGNQQYEALAIGGAWALFRIFSWTLWCYIAADAALVGGQAFAIGHIALMLASTVAESASTLVPPANIPLTVSVSGIVLLTVLNSTLVMNEGSLLPVVKNRGADAEGEEGQVSTSRGPREAEADPAALARRQVERAAQAHDLSEREQEIAVLVLLGKDNAQISSEISIAGSTLRTHLRNIYGKANVHSRKELVELLRSMEE